MTEIAKEQKELINILLMAGIYEQLKELNWNIQLRNAMFLYAINKV